MREKPIYKEVDYMRKLVKERGADKKLSRQHMQKRSAKARLGARATLLYWAIGVRH